MGRRATRVTEGDLGRSGTGRPPAPELGQQGTPEGARQAPWGDRGVRAAHSSDDARRKAGGAKGPQPSGTSEREMGKPPEDGVGQLVLQIVFPSGEASDRTEETEANERDASTSPSAARSQPERKRKWYSLIDKVYALPNLQEAWRHVAANGGAPGIDGQTIAQFRERADERLQQLAQELRNKTYRPQPVRRVFIPKAGKRGGQRPLGIPTVRDRIVQQALRQRLEPIFEAKFSPRSHGFRPERGCATALEVVDRAVKHGYDWVVDADLEAFFDTVDHEKLLAALNEEIADGSVLRLVAQILRAGVVLPEAAETEPTELGTPQGGPLSPLLANVYLHAFDERMVQAGYGLVRYADDFVIFARSENEAAVALQLARAVLEGELGLVLHPAKTRVVSVAEGVEFLGYHYFRDPQTGALRKEVRRKSAQRFRDAIRGRTPRVRNQRKPKARSITRKRLASNEPLRQMIREVNRFLVGWHWYFKAVWSRYPKTPFRNLDSFVRQRVRTAITGRIGAGWWNRQLPNALLRELGLIGLDELQREYQAGQLAPPVRKDRLGGEPYAGKPHVRFGKAGGRATAP
jgi:RNA-directed DNA polymerase